MLFMLPIANIFAQGTYVSFNAGFGAKMSSQNLPDYYNYTQSDNYNGENNSRVITSEQINASLGKGLNFGLSIGNMFNKNIGAELGVSYLMGGKTKAKDSYSTNGTVNETTDYTISAKMLRIVPTLVFTPGMEKINPYAKFGLIVGLGTITEEHSRNIDGDVNFEKTKYKGGLALGLNTALGVAFDLNEKMSFFGELNMVNLSYAPKKGEVTEATYNGADQLPDMTTSDKKIEFVDKVTTNSSNPQLDSEATKELKTKLPFGSIGLNIGIHFKL